MRIDIDRCSADRQDHVKWKIGQLDILIITERHSSQTYRVSQKKGSLAFDGPKHGEFLSFEKFRKSFLSGKDKNSSLLSESD